MYTKFSFLIGFIISIGFYRIFFSINRPESKGRSVALILISIFFIPLFYFWKDFCMRYTSLPVNTILLNMIYYILVSIAIVLLSAHRGRAIICAVFALTVKNLMEVPILFFIGAIAGPSVSLEDFLTEGV
jgi:hypothetical protein